MEKNELHGDLVGVGNLKKEECGTICVHNVTEMLQKHAELCGEHASMSCPKRWNALPRAESPSITTKYILSFYKEVKKKVMRFRDSGDFRNTNSDPDTKPFVALTQLLSEQIVTTLQSGSFVAYHMHAIVPNLSGRRRQCLVDIEHSFMWFLLADCTEEQVKEEESGENEENSMYGFTLSVTAATGRLRIETVLRICTCVSFCFFLNKPQLRSVVQRQNHILFILYLYMRFLEEGKGS